MPGSAGRPTSDEPCLQSRVISEVAALYLDLMKRCLTDSIYGDDEPGPNPKDDRFDATIRFRGAPGGKWPSHAHTMVGMTRLDNIQACAESVLTDGIPGDFIETGVWRGGATIFMRAILEAYGAMDRVVWVADSFRGLPPPDPRIYPADADDRLHTFSKLAISLETVRGNFERYGLLDERVRFLEGWFNDTLPSAPIERLAVLRLDGDMYGSTWVALDSLYPKLSRGGYVIIDDYALPACRLAVEDFRHQHGIEDAVERIDWTGVFWRRA
jgi:O-methyltransferase